MLAANVFDKNAKPFTGYDAVIDEKDGIKVGIFGLSVRITEDLQTTTNLGGTKEEGGLHFTDVEDKARETILALKQQGAEVIIALTHQGIEDDKKLARAAEDLDLHLIVGGRTHINLLNGFQTFDTKIVMAGHRGEHLGKVVIRYDRNKKVVTSITPTVIPVTDSAPIDAKAEEIINEYSIELQALQARPVGRTDVFLEGSRNIVRKQETNLANFIADALREENRADMCLINAGLIRASIDPGDTGVISYGDIMNVLPYSNMGYVVRLKGKMLTRIFEKSAASDPEGEGRFLQVSGVSYKIRGRTLADLLHNGRPIDPERIYTVATTDFLAAGGDNYTEFLQNEGGRLGDGIADSIIKAIQRADMISPRVEGRIQRLE
jgi:5'-nucleotidase